jgi:hypothetical protein
MAQVGKQVAGELGRVAARRREPLDRLQGCLRVLGGHRVHRLEEQVRIGGAEQLEHRIELDLLAAEGDQLVEGGEGVAKASGGGAGEHCHGRVVDD